MYKWYNGNIQFIILLNYKISCVACTVQQFHSFTIIFNVFISFTNFVNQNGVTLKSVCSISNIIFIYPAKGRHMQMNMFKSVFLNQIKINIMYYLNSILEMDFLLKIGLIPFFFLFLFFSIIFCLFIFFMVHHSQRLHQP